MAKFTVDNVKNDKTDGTTCTYLGQYNSTCIILSTFINLPFVIKIFFILILSGILNWFYCIPYKTETHTCTVTFPNFLENNYKFSYFIYTTLKFANRTVYHITFTHSDPIQFLYVVKNRVWVIFKYLRTFELEIWPPSAPETYHSSNDSDIILWDRCQFMRRLSDHLRKCSNIMMAPDVTL